MTEIAKPINLEMVLKSISTPRNKVTLGDVWSFLREYLPNGFTSQAATSMICYHFGQFPTEFRPNMATPSLYTRLAEVGLLKVSIKRREISNADGRYMTFRWYDYINKEE